MSQRILHFAEDGDTSGFFPQLGRWHDRGRYQMSFGTLKPMAPWLRAFMENEGVECFSCECQGRLEYPLGMLRLARYLRAQRIEILHTHLFDPSVVGLVGGLMAGTPYRVMTRHYSDYHTRIGKTWHVRLDQACNRLSHKIIAVSQHTGDHLVRDEGCPAAKIEVIHNGIDFERVRVSSSNAPERLRREFAPGGETLLLVVGRLHPEKGYTYLFPAIGQLRQLSARPFVLLVAGRGAFEQQFRDQVRALGCDDVVRFLGFRRDVTDLMAAADLLVLPSVAEAFGLVLTEALYLGTPVVAARVGGIPEIVTDGEDGVLVPAADSDALARALAALLDDPGRLRALAGAGREKVRERFGFEDMVRAYESLYERLGDRQPEALHA